LAQASFYLYKESAKIPVVFITTGMFKKYIINFWIWWYGVNLVSIFHSVYSFWSLSLANLNILPMFANLFVPMYQDQTLMGKALSLFLRFMWVIFGSLIQFLITIPLIFILSIWVLLPPLCLIQIFRFFI
jgi:hypothetical protein